MTSPVIDLSVVTAWLHVIAGAVSTPAGGAAVTVALLVGTALRVAVRRARHRWLCTGARMVTVLTPPDVPADAAKAWWGTVAGLLRPRWKRLVWGQPHLSFEYVITPAAATIRVWVPGPIPPGMIERSLAAAWPGATTRTALAPPLQRPPTSDNHDRSSVRRFVTVGGVLRLARPSALPISDGVAGDPIAALLTATTPAGPTAATAAGAGQVIVQVLARPVPARRAGRSGRPGIGRVLDLAGRILAALAHEALMLLSPGRVRGKAPVARGASIGSFSAGDPRARLELSSSDRAAVAKAHGAAFETLVRYAVTTPVDINTARDTDIGGSDGGDVGGDVSDAPVAYREALARARGHARGNAQALTSTFAAFTGHNFYRRHRLRRPVHAVVTRRLGRGDLLSTTELAAIAALPTGPVPNLLQARARSVPPPPDVPRPGPEVKPLGDATPVAAGSIGSGRRGRAVGVSVPDARHHLHVVGSTGTGKSTLLVQLILADIRRRRGVVVIDPKGDLVTDVLAHLPPAKRQQALIIDPDRQGPLPGLNPLNPPRPDRRDDLLVVENLVTIFQRVFAASWGPRTDDVMRAACLTLRAQPTPRSLIDLPTLLSDPDIRSRHLRAVTDPVLRGFWDWYEQLSDSARAHVTAPLMNKVRAMLLRPFLRTLLTGPGPDIGPGTGAAEQVDLSRVLDGGILLARLPKGSLGDEGTRLVGSIIVAHTWAAATARAIQPVASRRDASLVIDECHNFLNLAHSLDDVLAEARGLRLSAVLAHQNLAQLGRDLREGISANARNKLIFNVGPEDARELARHTHPRLDEHDLSRLDAFTAAARLVVDGAETAAFTLHTRPLPSCRTPPYRPTRRTAVPVGQTSRPLSSQGQPP
ncbi:type IV secretion system DNA-binding domain-containing protein [Pseudonocardia sp. TRM90224]|uniref:type IV secretion system DNA-binding domain-containing protein n=1 Tax=Pseudonocardia sp. TRM90224 TaxID=2812678 RepID=UPI001E383DEA|nr:type IV secretion system DNA-binding domain-containing protein [Pseudonocardia sp. TRM90224]